MTVEYVCTHAATRWLAGEKAKRLIRPVVSRHMRAATAGTSGKLKLHRTHRNPHCTPMSTRLRALLAADMVPDIKHLSHLLGKGLANWCRSATP